MRPVFTPDDCYWFFNINGPDTFSSTASYFSGLWENYPLEIRSRMKANVVVTSLDLQVAHNVYAVATVESSVDSSYTGSVQHVLSSDLDSTVQQLTAHGAVVTAIAPDSDNSFQVISSSGAGDTVSKYEATVVTAEISAVGKEFQVLASQGYILTALGGTRDSGMRLVGTRLMNHTKARPSLVSIARL